MFSALLPTSDIARGAVFRRLRHRAGSAGGKAPNGGVGIFDLGFEVAACTFVSLLNARPKHFGQNLRQTEDSPCTTLARPPLRV